eukprot:TRINITY_DN18356_c0_g1_i1.p2 TRINITY_DN18356_c0_g1~~TRINITY_DN18356_c0_g1_i1.p2  ORF type:complete len:124 (+),score=14.43 TRINITY_DN18356_c0_g1_i1:25-372(+)
MVCWPCVGYRHMSGTTGMDAAERRSFEYASQCSDCGAKLNVDGKQDYVAAHVLAYPCCVVNWCIGCPVLKTTCKKCNRNEGCFFARTILSGECCCGPLLGGCRCQPCCVTYNAKQ